MWSWWNASLLMTIICQDSTGNKHTHAHKQHLSPSVSCPCLVPVLINIIHTCNKNDETYNDGRTEFDVVSMYVLNSMLFLMTTHKHSLSLTLSLSLLYICKDTFCSFCSMMINLFTDLFWNLNVDSQFIYRYLRPNLTFFFYMFFVLFTFCLLSFVFVLIYLHILFQSCSNDYKNTICYFWV